MNTEAPVTTVRRSVALPRSLVEKATSLAPPRLQGNFNRLVATALEEYAEKRRATAFADAMAEMARDPGIRRACEEIAQEFMITETDGLEDNSSSTDKQTNSDALQNLIALMEQCQRDTLEALGAGAAGRLANWQRHEHSLEEPVEFIRERLLVKRENGFKLRQQKRLSLEEIVVNHHPKLFRPEDVELAEATLNGVL